MRKKGSLRVLFAFNMCMVNTDEMPRGGVIVVPANPPGTWYAVCSTTRIIEIFVQELHGTFQYPMDIYPVCSFKVGNESTADQLKRALEEIGFQVEFVNTPPWQQE